MLERLPWHVRQWELIDRACQNNRLPHAVLLCGPPGIGLNSFADSLAAGLLCFSPSATAMPCGECKSCVLFSGDSHPDCCMITPEEKGKQIKVAAIRELIEFIQLKSQYERNKVAIISPAEGMNRTAANTLLKTLEEPPAASIMLLISYQPDHLPATIRSRCQQIHFQPDYSRASIEWLQPQSDGIPATTLLKMAHGAPLAAVRMLQEDHPAKRAVIIEDLLALYRQQQDPVKIAEKWNKLGAGLALQWMLDLLADMIRLKSGAAVAEELDKSDDQFSRLQQMLNRLHLEKLMQLYDLTLKNYGLSQSSVSYNTQALLEDVIIQWQYQ